MEQEVKKLALKQYFRYFRFWFIAAGVLLVLTMGVWGMKTLVNMRPRGNKEPDKERVYDYADALSKSEKKELEKYIEKYQKKCRIDIVLLMTDEPMGVDDNTWTNHMMNRADDFYDEGKFGYDEPYGDGVLLLYNWYEDEENGSQKGVWLSTSGKMEKRIGAREEDVILDAFERYFFRDQVKGYKAAIQEIAAQGSLTYGERLPFGAIIFIPLVVAIVYLISNLTQVKAKDTTTASTYVANGKPVVNSRSDDFIRKHVTSHRVQSSSGGGHSGGHSGGGSHGSHRSSSGHSHGGGGRRH